MLGTRWSPRSYELRDFLARNHVPYQWIDVELSANDPETKRLLEALGPEAANLPVVLFPDGTKLLESVPADVAQKVGLRTRAQTSFLRSGDRWRRAGGSGRGRLRRVGRPAYGDGRAGSARRTGGHEFAHRKLSGISRRTERRRSGPARGGAGPAFWRGNPVAAGSGRRPDGRLVPDHQVGGRQRDFLPRA